MDKSDIHHIRNKSLNESELSSVIGSPFANITKQKSWSSTNNLSQLSPNHNYNNILSKRNCYRKNEDIRIDLNNLGDRTINSISTVNSISSISEDSSESENEENIIPGRKRKSILNDANLYITNLGGYFYYILLTSLFTLIINGSTREKYIFPIDSIFFLYMSPIFYKLAFRQIFFYSMKNDKKIIKYYYPTSIILGFCIRFLDYIPFFQKFVLNTQDFIDNPAYIALFCSLILYLFLIFLNELYQSTYKKINLAFLVVGGFFIFLTISYSLDSMYILHIHHYFIGLLFHIVCQTKKSKISIINNGLGLGIFLEGISKWGFAKLYYRIPTVIN